MTSSPHGRNSQIVPIRREANLVVTPVDDEMVVYDLERDEVHSLNGVSSAVWRSCNGSSSVHDAVVHLSAELGVSEADANDLWDLAVRQLPDAQLLGEHTPTGLPRPNRRQVLRAVGRAALLPVVFTMAAPTIASAQSGGGLLPLGAPCTTSRECQSGCCAGPRFRRTCVGGTGTGRGACK